MITIAVRVSGGVAPLPIEVFIDRDSNSHDDDIIIKSPISFKETLSLIPADYAIVVSGKNPKGGKTEIWITGTDSHDNTVNLYREKPNSNYSAVFALTY